MLRTAFGSSGRRGRRIEVRLTGVSLFNQTTQFGQIARGNVGGSITKFLDDAFIAISVLEGLDDSHRDESVNVDILEGRGKGTAFGEKLLASHVVRKLKVGEGLEGNEAV